MEEKLDKVADALDWDRSTISVDTPLDTLQWDSMAKLTVIAVARANGKVVTGANLNAMKTVGDLIAAI